MITHPAILDKEPCKAKPTATAQLAMIEPIPAVSIPTYPKKIINNTRFSIEGFFC